MKIISDMSKARSKSDDYEGDRVFAAQGPEPKEDGTNGTVITRLPEAPDIRSIGVSFDDNEYRAYFSNGYYSSYDSFPSLFWRQPEITIPERPRRMVKKSFMLIRHETLGGICHINDRGYRIANQEVELLVMEREDDKRD